MGDPKPSLLSSTYHSHADTVTNLNILHQKDVRGVHVTDRYTDLNTETLYPTFLQTSGQLQWC